MLRVQAKIAKRDFDVDLEVPDFGEGGPQHIAIMGPNGSGKSTIIELLAGTLVPDSGLVNVGSKVLAHLDDRGSGQFVAPHERRIGLLAQDALLFPHMTVLENVGFAPRSSGEDPKAAARTAHHYLELVGCAIFADRKPRELSGGQAQRVAIARTLAAQPELILLDEPMAALDFDSVPQVLELLKEILKERRSIMVTHDLLDAATLADYLVVVDRGRIVESGPIATVLANPQSPFGERLAGFTRLRQTIQQDDLDS